MDHSTQFSDHVRSVDEWSVTSFRDTTPISVLSQLMCSVTENNKYKQNAELFSHLFTIIFKVLSDN